MYQRMTSNGYVLTLDLFNNVLKDFLQEVSSKAHAVGPRAFCIYSFAVQDELLSPCCFCARY